MDHGLVRNVPILTGRRMAPMVAFWERLGLHVTADFEDYVIMATREAYDPADPDAPGEGPGAAEVHLSRYDEHDPYTTAGSVYLRVRDAQVLWDRLQAELAAEGLLREEIEAKPWGTLQFGIVDPEGNLVQIGSLL